MILARSTLPAWQRQRPDPVQHVAEQPAVQMPFGQQQPVIPRVLEQTAQIAQNWFAELRDREQDYGMHP